MDYSRQINERWVPFGGRARQEVDADLGSGSVFRLIGAVGSYSVAVRFAGSLMQMQERQAVFILKKLQPGVFLLN